MSYTIAITGKGGTGKTTIAALLVANLVRRGKRPVLAVDADPNSCLDLALGVKAANTVGRLREDARDLAAANPALSKRELLEMKISESLVEAMILISLPWGVPRGPAVTATPTTSFATCSPKYQAATPTWYLTTRRGWRTCRAGS